MGEARNVGGIVVGRSGVCARLVFGEVTEPYIVVDDDEDLMLSVKFEAQKRAFGGDSRQEEMKRGSDSFTMGKRLMLPR